MTKTQFLARLHLIGTITPIKNEVFLQYFRFTRQNMPPSYIGFRKKQTRIRIICHGPYRVLQTSKYQEAWEFITNDKQSDR